MARKDCEAVLKQLEETLVKKVRNVTFLKEALKNAEQEAWEFKKSVHKFKTDLNNY